MLYAFWFAWYATHGGQAPVGEQSHPAMLQEPIALELGRIWREESMATNIVLVNTPTGTVTARYKVLGTLARGAWLWGWIDPSVPPAARIEPGTLSIESSIVLSDWNPSTEAINALMREMALKLGASYFGQMKTALGSQFVLILDAVPLPPPPADLLPSARGAGPR